MVQESWEWRGVGDRGAIQMAGKRLDPPIPYAREGGKLGKVGKGVPGALGNNGCGGRRGDAGEGIKLIGPGGIEIKTVRRGIKARKGNTTGERHRARRVPDGAAALVPEQGGTARGGNQHTQHDRLISTSLHGGTTFNTG